MEGKITKSYTVLLDAIRLMNSNSDYKKVLEFIIEISTRLLQAKDSSLFLLDETNKELYVQVAKGSKGDALKTVRLKIGQGIAGWVARNGVPRLVNDVKEDSQFFQNVDQSIGFTTQSIIAVPLKANHKILGVLEVVNSKLGNNFTQAHVELLQQFADQAAVTLMNAKRISQLSKENEILKEELSERYKIVSASENMERILGIAKRAAMTDATVLIQSESGTGKELVARYIHGSSKRVSGPFVAVNCAALNDDLLESELFGHEKGAFTGAHSQKKGKLELANGGTFFFDEIGELKLSLQAKLLRALQEQVVDRIGGQQPVKLDVRIIVATNRDLKKEVELGNFREDLYYRINVIPIFIPPLRERRDEIERLAYFFVGRYCMRTGQKAKTIALEALKKLKAYPWPGNVRELENIIERLVVLVPNETITLDDIPPDLRIPLDHPPQKALEVKKNSEQSRAKSYHDSVNLMRKTIIINALDDSQWNRGQAAKTLEIQPSYLSKLIKDLGIKEPLMHSSTN